MLRRCLFLLCLVLKPISPSAQGPVPVELVARNSYVFSYDRSSLSGPGAKFLREQTADSQFVLLGEDHMDHEIPIFAGALFHMLHDRRASGTSSSNRIPSRSRTPSVRRCAER